MLEEAQARVDQFDRLVGEVQAQIEAERREGPPNVAELQATIQAIKDEIEHIQARIEKAKAQAKKRKREIDDWKQWYHTLPGVDRSEEQAKLAAEINWRGAEITARQDEIGVLESQKWAAKERWEKAKQRLSAVEEGVYDRPIEQDPRLLSVQAARQAAAAALEAARTSLKS
jgi:chromosome segregation ATPase